MKKKLGLICILLSISSISNIQASEYQVKVNDTYIPISLIDEAYYIPARYTLEALGFIVDWDADSKKVIATSDKHTICIDSVNNCIYADDSSEFELPFKVRIIDGRTYIPVDDPMYRTDMDIINFLQQGG